MTFFAAILATLAVLPSDRMAMADRLFDRGAYADARAEYAALKGVAGVAEDELLYRLAECARALGDKAAARAGYGGLLNRFPLSRHAARARLMRALAGTEAEQRAELKLLDADSVPPAIRATALYHLGALTNDADAFERCVKLDPNGRHAPYAKFRRAALAAESPDPAVRRSAIGGLMDIHFGKDKDADLAREALYLAAMRSYGDRRYGEASSLFRRYMKVYPGDAREAASRTMAAWSDHLSGKHADAAALCGTGESDDAAYLLAACAYATGDHEKARRLMLDYLERFPAGKYRAAVELPLARMEFSAAEKGADLAKMLETAKRSAALSKTSADRMRLAWAYEKASRPDAAAAEYAAVARDFPSTDDAAESLFRKAMIDLRAKRWSAAELALAEALETGKNAKRRAESLYWRGVAAGMLGHEAKRAEFIRDALATGGLSLDETREAGLMLADADFRAGRIAEAKAAYAKLVREGACDRMSAAKMRSVGRFLLECREGGDALEEAKICARAMLLHADTPEWRQAAHALKGAAEEAASEFNAAVESYRSSLAEKTRTEDARAVALALGVLESKSGAHVEADRTLKEAVSLNAADNAARARAYLWLARNCEAMTDYRGACAYATVVLTLFDDSGLTAEAKKILEAHPGEAK